MPARLLLLLAFLCLTFGKDANAELLRLTHAQALITVQGHTKNESVTLPYNWDIVNNAQPGVGVFELPFDMPQGAAEPWGLYIPSLGNAYEIRLNGTVLQREGDLLHGNGADFAKVPRFVVISPILLGQENLLRVHIRTDAERRGGLSEIFIGPQGEAYAAYKRNDLWRSEGSLLVVAFSLAVGVLSLGLWLTQVDYFRPNGPRREPLYLFAALAEVCWTLAVGDALIETPPLPWPWWGAIPTAGATAWACNMQLFCIEIAGWRTQPFVILLRRWLLLLIPLGALLPLWAAGKQQPLALSLWHGAMALTFLGFGYVFLRQAINSNSRAHKLAAIALFINLLVGIWDLCNFRLFPSFPDNSMLRFSSLFFGISLAAIVIARFRRANYEAGRLLATLSARIEEKEADLHASYRELEVQVREHERSSERARILRDMHDGVGSHISMAIRQLQSSSAERKLSEDSEVLHTLHDALDQLKLSIDAINLPSGDVTSLLANLRYRLEPRLKASGIELIWEVDLLPVITAMEASAMRHLQFMLYEALSNVLQHAHAKTVRIEAHALPKAVSMPLGPNHACVVLRVVDDGCGFQEQSALRKGLASMYERAHAVGAKLTIQSRPGQTRIEIELG